MLLNSTSIPNLLLEAIIFTKEFPPLETRILLYICRKTIGWNKETDWITQDLMARQLGRKSSSNIYLDLRSLQKKQAIAIEDKIENGKKKRYYHLNQDRWILKSSPFNARQGHLSTQGEPHLSTQGATKDNNIQKTLSTESINKLTLVNTSAPLKEHGNGDINFLHSYLKEKLKIGVLDGSIEGNRFACNVFLKKLKKAFPSVEASPQDLGKRVIDLAFENDFHKTKITSFMYLRDHFLKIIGDSKNAKKQIVFV